MAYVGNSPTQQSFTGGVDQYNGNNSNTVFGLTRTINTVYDVDVYVENVWQRPTTGYTVSANTITFTSAPPAGSNNVVVVYKNFSATSIVPQQGSVFTSSLGSITNINSGTNADLTIQANNATVVSVAANGNFGLGVSSPTNALHVNSPVASTVARLSSNNTAAYLMLSDSGSASGLGQGIGSSGNNIVVRANSAIKATFAANGNVGIACTSPTHTLEVIGDNNNNTMRLNVVGSGSTTFRIDTVNDNAANRNWAFRNRYNAYGRFELMRGTTNTEDPLTPVMWWNNDSSATMAANVGINGTIIATGGQIAFPATQVASADANTLDDYEEGTFTPSLTFGGGSTGLTYSWRYGNYTKIGNVVTCQLNFGLSAKGSSTGDAYVTIPFTNKVISGTFAYIAGGSYAGNYGLVFISAEYGSAYSSFSLQRLSGATSNTVAVMTHNDFTDTTRIALTFSYYTS